MNRSAAALVLLGARHYLYYAWPAEQQGDVFNICGALFIVAAIGVAGVWWPIAAWAIGEEMLVAGCSAWALFDPPGYLSAEQCSTRVGFKIGSVGLCVLAYVAWQFAIVKVYRSRIDDRKRQ